jgi:serine/threonine protein kinase
MTGEKVVIGNYSVISELAMGGFGRVYLAQHSVLTNRLVALKLMHTIPLSSEYECNQFLQEARFLELLHHGYILPILDVGIHQGMPYIVSEYASGGSLRDRLKIRAIQPLELEELQRILSQIGEALQYAHHSNIIHRDLKPENILFNARGDALLADFGLATTLAAASIKYLSNAGTPRYMSPEQFQGVVSKESDQYALGCIAYELWTGHPLFSGPDPVSLMYKHVNEAPVPLSKFNPGIPLHIEQAILKALAKNRHDRHADIRAFITALCSSTFRQQGPELDTGLTFANSTRPELTSSVTYLVKPRQPMIKRRALSSKAHH